MRSDGNNWEHFNRWKSQILTVLALRSYCCTNGSNRKKVRGPLGVLSLLQSLSQLSNQDDLHPVSEHSEIPPNAVCTVNALDSQELYYLGLICFSGGPKTFQCFFLLFFSFQCFIQNPEGKNITQKTNWGQVCLPSFCSPGSFYPIFPNSKFHFLCFQFTSPPFFMNLVFGVPLMLNLFQWSFPRDWQSLLGWEDWGKGWGCSVTGQEERPKAATVWATGAEGEPRKEKFLCEVIES